MDHISLFPVNTWKKRENGLRADLVQALYDLNPGVFRFPGGCIIEGNSLATRYQWKNSVGPVENRPLNENRWNYTFKHKAFPDYFQSYGLGFYEYFLLSEDLGAEPLPVLSCGLSCQYESNEVVPLGELGPYVQDALDLIEFANGAATSKWGKVRADMGHPEPFGLKMIAIGNEQRDGIYMERKYLPGIVGVTGNPKANVGSVRSKGFDGNFAYKQKIGKVNLTVRGNFTYSKNEILEKDEMNAVYPYQKEAGYRVNQAKGLIALGLFKDYDDIRNSPQQTNWGKVQPGDIKYKDVNGDGIINGSDEVAIGATTKPNLIYGFGISAQWKGFDFNAHFQGAGKSSFFINGPTVYAFSGSQWGNVLTNLVKDRYIDAETAATLGIPANENPNASYPRLSYGGNDNNYRASTYWLRDGSYLRLKTLEIGYTLPKAIVNKMRFNKIRVFFIGTNLLTFAKFKEWDPEMGSTNGEKYPLAKTFTLGLTVNI